MEAGRVYRSVIAVEQSCFISLQRAVTVQKCFRLVEGPHGTVSMEQTAGHRTPRPQQHFVYDPTQPQSKNQVLISHGRAPWYGPDGRNVEAYVVGIAGGSASGKVRPQS